VIPRDLATALDSIRPGLEADGFDLYVKSETAGDVIVCLAATAEACLDCLVPDDLLQQIVESALREAAPGIRKVILVKEGFDAHPAH
jgi:Fe-S cluster biogenesis protein NfuA